MLGLVPLSEESPFSNSMTNVAAQLLHLINQFSKIPKMCTFETGEVYEDKTEHCSNFLHRANFALMNDAPDVTNFYHLSNFSVRQEACKSGRHCLDDSPLYAIVGKDFIAIHVASDFPRLQGIIEKRPSHFGVY